MSANKKDSMNSLANFFITHTPLMPEIAYWGTMKLKISNYITPVIPPAEFISSVRCVLFKEDKIMVIQNPNGENHVMPGGRCEPGETLEETGRREILEEVGWHMGPLKVIGTRRFHHLTPKPNGYKYPYPDFLQLIYTAEATLFSVEGKQFDRYVASAEFYPITAVSKIDLSPGERLFFNTALQNR
ncbi:MAG: NUDIX domain-containing protein [Chloroflexota bacterium]